jgi:hypothetical protein
VGIIICGFGLSAAFLNFFSEALINPTGDKMIDNYYSEEIAKRVYKYFYKDD